MFRTTIIFLALGATLLATAAPEQGLETVLTEQYRDKVLALRHALKPSRQEYAPDGNPIHAAEEGPWTLYGRITVNKITVNSQHVTVEGKRALFFFDSNGKLVQFKDDGKHPAENLSLAVRLQQPLASVDDARAMLDRVFALSPEDTVKSVPEFWRGHLAKQLGVELPEKAGSEHTSEPVEAGATKDLGKVANLSELREMNTSAPRALQAPEPGYTEAARKRGLQGVVGLNIVIDPAGRVRNIKLVHPLGMGLDESAIAAVGTWRFAPAKKNGQPVPVAVYIEVDFRLY